MPDLLTAEGMTMRFGGLTAVDAVDFAVPEQKVVSLIGPNGAGKTTFFNMLTGLYRATSGRLTLLGDDITGLPAHEIAARGIARTFQNIRLFGAMSTIDNVLVGMHARLRGGLWHTLLHTRSFRQEERAALRRAAELLNLVGLTERHGELATSLPYGDQRRLEIARALASEPRILLLDEPAAGMNPQETADLATLIATLPDKTGASVLLIEHEMKLVMQVSARVTVLDYGRKIAEGSPEQVRNDPAVIEAYLGGGTDSGAAGDSVPEGPA